MRSKLFWTVAGVVVVVLMVVIPATALAGTPVPPGQGKAHVTAVTTASTTRTSSKVSVCHRTGNPRKPWVSVSVSANAWPALKARGDFLVDASHPCPPSTTTTSTSSSVTTASATTVTITQPVTTTITLTLTSTTTARP